MAEEIAAEVQLAKLNEAHLNELRQIFDAFDLESKGMILTQQLGRMLLECGHHAEEEELFRLMCEIDPHGLGTFTFDNFAELAAKRLNCLDDEKFGAELRDLLDMDGYGAMSVQELRELLETMGGPRTLNAKEREELLRHADPDRDGRIYVDDLYALLTGNKR